MGCGVFLSIRPDAISILCSRHWRLRTFKVLLAGITLPPNYGPEYMNPFNRIFVDLAAKHHVALVPMIYKDLVNVPGTIQPDGIHPTAKGAEIVAKTLLGSLKPLLRK